MTSITHFIEFIQSGGFVMAPLILCSILTWVVIIERWMAFRKLKDSLSTFHLQASTLLLRGDFKQLSSVCGLHAKIPSARLLGHALDRVESKEEAVRHFWRESVERERLLENQNLKKNLWVLGTIANAAPFIGLFGTVVGILQSFSDIQKSGRGGFDVVAGGISESLIATASGIVVGIIAVAAFNTFQARLSDLLLHLKVQVQDLCELLSKQKFGTS